jgi:hypothetical protein
VLMLQRVVAALRGWLWLVRGSGLRARLDAITDAVRSLPAAPQQAVLDGLAPSLHALTDQSAATRAEVTAVAERLARLEAAVKEDARARRRADWARAGDLRAAEFRVFSQNGEDGIIQEIFRRIGTRSRYFVEFGVETGEQCNCALLARERGWAGLFLELHPQMFEQLQANYRHLPSVRCVRSRVTSANVEALFSEASVPEEFDLLSIDIDGNDFWVWRAVEKYRPRVVVAEYNAFYPPPRRWVMQENDDYCWNGTSYFGASLASLVALGRAKGYTLVGTDTSGVNCFFVRDDCLGTGLFLDPVLHYYFMPYERPPLPPHDGPSVEI